MKVFATTSKHIVEHSEIYFGFVSVTEIR